MAPSQNDPDSGDPRENESEPTERSAEVPSSGAPSGSSSPQAEDADADLDSESSESGQDAPDSDGEGVADSFEELDIAALDLEQVSLDLDAIEPESLRKVLEEMLQEQLPDPIPEELFLLYDDGPPSRCGICGDSLEDGRAYQIERCFRPGRDPEKPRVVMEICMCRSCCGSASREISEESLLKLQSLLSDLKGWSSEECMACGQQRHLCESYSLAAMCRLDYLLAPPLLICDECNANIHSQLSRATRDALGDFVRDNIPGLPADIDMLPSLF